MKRLVRFGSLFASLFLLLAAASPVAAVQHTLGLFLDDSAACNGYTLFCPLHYGTAYLINDSGMLCHSWPSIQAGQCAWLLENGELLHTGNAGNNSYFPNAGGGGRFMEYDWDGNLVWSFKYSDSMHLQHHEVRQLPNGNVLAIAYDRVPYSQAIAEGRRPDYLPDSVVWADEVIEVQQTGESTGTVIWEWHVQDHLIQDYDSTKLNFGVVGNHPELVDFNFGPTKACWNHTNSIYYNADLDQILLSVRNNSEIWVIDHSTTTTQAASHTGGKYGHGGDLLYRWGNPQAYRAGTASDQKLFQQHDAEWIPAGCPGTGHMTIFNNGLGRPGGNYTTVDEIVPPVDSLGNYYLPTGGHYGPDTMAWIYAASPETSFHSLEIGCAQREPNGNTLIDDGTHGVFFEIAPDTSMVWRYVNPVSDSGPLYQGDTAGNDPNHSDQKMSSVFKIHRYAPDYAGLVGHDLTPQGPIERHLPGVAEQAARIVSAPRLLTNLPGVLTIANLPAQGEVELYSVSGRLLRRTAVAVGQSSLRLDLKSLPAGACLCVVKGASGEVALRAKAVIIR
ncbi:MAG TPA: aryl-sulfate sulfotransferase [bacterium]|nr:aryl-sulfate sulfotransferase [bacterium]